MRTIKRYSNRKLYDTTEKHYVTLSDVASCIRRGDEVSVVHHVTGASMTTQTLAQIVFEEEKRSPRVAAEVFLQIIRTGAPK